MSTTTEIPSPTCGIHDYPSLRLRSSDSSSGGPLHTRQVRLFERVHGVELVGRVFILSLLATLLGDPDHDDGASP